ncbi:MAG: 1-phosphofructokinase family hexose kinase [Actinomycetota bacterium]|nr:1-phosphofructokinase family hexose kinase [Actinomycetota bacterium]
MILTVTLNLALDVTYRVRRLRAGRSHTLELVRAQAGGKGVNVSRILKQLGVPTLAAGFVGGVTGDSVVKEMTKARLDHRLIPVPGETRRCMAVISEDDGSVTEINERGPDVPTDAWQEFAEVFEELIDTRDIRVTVVSGSLPPGVPVEAYATLCRVSHKAEIPVILDSSGDALREGLKGRPDVVKPNRDELLEALEDEKISTPKPSDEFLPSKWVPVVQGLRAKGAGAVVASFGPDGLLAVTDEGTCFARPPLVSGNPVGAGDGVTASLARGVLEGRKWPERVRDATALSSAVAASVTAGTFDPAVYALVGQRTVTRTAFVE